MFNDKKIKKLEDKIEKLEDKIDSLIDSENNIYEIIYNLAKRIDKRIDNLTKDNKANYARELKREQIELMEKGKKVVKIRRKVK